MTSQPGDKLTELFAQREGESLELSERGLDGSAVLELLADERIKGVRRLGLAGNQIEDSGVLKLASCAALKKLRFLDLSANPCSLAGLAAVFRSQVFKNQLLELRYTDNDLSDKRAEFHLLTAPRALKKLEILDLSRCRIGGKMINLLTHMQCNLMTLSELILRGNEILAEDAWSLCSFSSRQAKKLLRLDLADNQLKNAGAEKIASDGRYPNLQSLDLSGNGITQKTRLKKAFKQRFKVLSSLKL